VRQDDFIGGIAPFIGRLLIGGVFLVNAVGLSGAFTQVAQMMATKGVPAAAALLALTIVAWLIGGVCLVAGYRVRTAAPVLAMLMVPVTLGIHAPWTADAASFHNELNHFLKNLGFIGGLLCVAAAPPGLFAVDARLQLGLS